MIPEPYKSLYAILLRRNGIVIKCEKLGEQYLITTERPVKTENENTGEAWDTQFKEYHLLSPTSL